MALAIVSVGSNLDRRTSIETALAALRARFGCLWVSRFRETPPVGLDDDSGAFWNGAVAFSCALSADALRAALHRLEEQAGRDRSRPDRARRARSLDLDLDLVLPEGGRVEAADLPAEPYKRPFVLEVLAQAGVAAPPPPAGPPGLALRVDGLRVGEAPTTLEAP